VAEAPEPALNVAVDELATLIETGTTTPSTASDDTTATAATRGARRARLRRITASRSIAPAADGLVLTVQPVDAAASDRGIPVTVTLTNTGKAEVAGSLSPFPTLTLSRDGIVLWHSNGPVPSIAQEVDLAPGAGITFQSTFEPVVCAAADDAPSGFRSELPAAGPGQYQLSAVVDFSPRTAGADGGAGAVLVTGPTSLVTLH
jgi:hypothetical protein